MKLHTVRNLLLLGFVFGLGFLTHAFIFPDVLVNGFSDVQNLVIPNVSPTPNQNTNDTFQTTITFDGTHFSRHSLVLPFESYIIIKNISQNSLMWLLSNYPPLATPRGYGYTEEINIRLDKRGTFVVEDKNNPSERIVITVK
jgi:hypothetical protein